MLIAGKMYAAKCFFNLGNSLQFDVSKRDNVRELKNELLRQFVAARTVEKFIGDARKNKISVYGKSHPKSSYHPPER